MFLLRLIEGRCVIFLSRRSRDYLKFTLRKRSYLLRQPTAAATPHRQSTMSTTMGRRFASVSNTFTVFQLPGQCSKGETTMERRGQGGEGRNVCGGWFWGNSCSKHAPSSILSCVILGRRQKFKISSPNFKEPKVSRLPPSQVHHRPRIPQLVIGAHWFKEYR